MDNISQHLPYETLLLTLCRVNRHLRKKIDPQLAPYETKVSPPGGEHMSLGYLNRFRVLPPPAVRRRRRPPLSPARQHAPLLHPLRRRRRHPQPPSDSVVVMDDPRAWVCGCLELLRYGTYHCAACHTHCPLRRVKPVVNLPQAFLTPTGMLSSFGADPGAIYMI
ncbi:hypothetical protein DL771_009993 [Monosporascus sp. 5C6A]|nr:hypothetical protein DL771_009993 [Monosporascus sp. 5C6A]